MGMKYLRVYQNAALQSKGKPLIAPEKHLHNEVYIFLFIDLFSIYLDIFEEIGITSAENAGSKTTHTNLKETFAIDIRCFT